VRKRGKNGVIWKRKRKRKRKRMGKRMGKNERKLEKGEINRVIREEKG